MWCEHGSNLFLALFVKQFVEDGLSATHVFHPTRGAIQMFEYKEQPLEFLKGHVPGSSLEEKILPIWAPGESVQTFEHQQKDTTYMKSEYGMESLFQCCIL